ncbi:hypothetical protein AQS8620_01511 [Aquimixticola soesokkakensis]|uniref:NIF system FeS cluster assembly NifU N-terminal domain-containing protein n=1 Tax=Aquimixticola soesokkakensis TaxID=1519096 RepID=A0A1Y5SL39_9RHOB|nr:iron-sulfur cluster assembly scaffold protein [Aquimixticola soesokkakensis]SLN40175.1 hypothetical protein AQS8620_01511 [Aquimixticola soesokkakensis]
MSDADLMSLYSGRILALTTAIPHTGRLPAPTVSAKRRAPLCGSTVSVDLVLDGERVVAFAQDVKACALGQAAASVVGSVVIGTTQAQIAQARAQLAAMLREDGPVPSAPFDGLEVLRAAKDYGNRHASILLALDATLDAFAAAKPQAAP